MEYDQQKSTHGSVASIVWIIGSVYLFWKTTGLASLVSLKAAAFVFGGMFVAAVVVGLFTYGIQRLIAKILLSRMPEGGPTQGYVGVVKITGLVLFIVDIIIAWFAVKFCFKIFILPGA